TAVTIVPSQGNRPINLGSNVAGSVSLTDGEFDHISTVALRIGNVSSGPITVSAAINLSNNTPATQTLHLTTSSTVTATAAGISILNLAVTAAGTVNFTTANDVTNLTVVSTSGAVTFGGDANGFSVNTVDGQSGVSAPGAVTLTTGGNLTSATGNAITS